MVYIKFSYKWVGKAYSILTQCNGRQTRAGHCAKGVERAQEP